MRGHPDRPVAGLVIRNIVEGGERAVLRLSSFSGERPGAQLTRRIAGLQVLKSKGRDFPRRHKVQKLLRTTAARGARFARSSDAARDSPPVTAVR